VQEFRTWSAEEKTPVWNAGLTFIYRRTIDAALTEEDDLPMTIADNAVLILTVRNRAGRLFAQELALGEAYVVLETLEDEAVHDVWLPLRPPAKTWSLETLLQPPPEPPLGQLHIILQKSLQPRTCRVVCRVVSCRASWTDAVFELCYRGGAVGVLW
jgi:hypothetical protein